MSRRLAKGKGESYLQPNQQRTEFIFFVKKVVRQLW